MSNVFNLLDKGLGWMDPIIQGSKETGAQLKTDIR